MHLPDQGLWTTQRLLTRHVMLLLSATVLLVSGCSLAPSAHGLIDGAPVAALPDDNEIGLGHDLDARLQSVTVTAANPGL